MKKVAIIGGGASGLICGIVCAKAGLKTVIYEQNKDIGKKITVSGNGKCNILNRYIKKEDFFTSSPKNLDHFFKTINFEKLKNFFRSWYSYRVY